MKFSKKATSIIEAMIVMTIVVSGVVSMYLIYERSIRFSENIKNKSQAVNIARE